MLADELYESVRHLPIVAPHTHVEAGWLLADRVPQVAELLVRPDHYLLRLLHACGEEPPPDGDDRELWRMLCRNWAAFRGTNSRLWLELQLTELFGLPGTRPAEATADELYDALAAQMVGPLVWLERFGLELLATTDAAMAPLGAHEALAGAGHRVVPTLRPDDLLDPSRPGWPAAIDALARVHDVDCSTWVGLVEALRLERARFVAAGAVATDHAPASARTLVLEAGEAAALYSRVRAAAASDDPPAEDDLEALGALLLTTMAELSCDDGLVMQLHAGVYRNHDGAALARLGPDAGADFPVPSEYTRPLQPLLERYGNSPGLTLVVYSVDEYATARELAPMASYYRALRLGAPWWFLDAPGSMRRWLETVSEVAGLSRLAGFVDDARGLCSIPVRHEVARRVFCEFVADLAVRGRLGRDEAEEAAAEFALAQPRRTFRV